MYRTHLQTLVLQGWELIFRRVDTIDLIILVIKSKRNCPSDFRTPSDELWENTEVCFDVVFRVVVQQIEEGNYLILKSQVAEYHG